MRRYRIAVAPMNEENVVVMFAKTDEWDRFITYIRTTSSAPFAEMLAAQINPTDDVNSVRLPKVHAEHVLKMAGVIL